MERVTSSACLLAAGMAIGYAIKAITSSEAVEKTKQTEAEKVALA